MRGAFCAALISIGLWAGVAVAGAPDALAIGMRGQGFAPAHARVAAGTRITWTNNDELPHSVTADDKRFDSGPLQPGQSFTWTADRPGAVAYHCIFHPSMTAMLDVYKPAQ
jgi:plastocyanin